MDEEVSFVRQFREVTSRTALVSLLKKYQAVLPSTTNRQFNSFYPIGKAILVKAIINRSILGCLTKKEHESLFVDLFCKYANSLDVISLLDEQFSKFSTTHDSEDSYFLEILVELAVNFVKRRCYDAEFQNLCLDSFSTKMEDFYDDLIKCIVNLSSRVSQILKGRIPHELVDINYVRSVTFAILNALDYGRSLLSNNDNCSLKFHSLLLSKLYAVGYGKICLNILVPFLRSKCLNDFVYRRLAQRIFGSIPRNLIEGFVLDVILAHRGRNNHLCKLSNLIGDLVLHDDKVKTTLTKKLIFAKYFDDFFVPVSIILYLKEFRECEEVIGQIFIDLLKFLSMETFISKVATEQYYYYCQTLMICLNQLSDQEIVSIKSKTLDLALKLIQTHLKSSKSSVVVYGQVIGEILMRKFSFDQNSPLKFDYKDNEKTLLLKGLSESLNSCDEDDAEIQLSDNFWLDHITDSLINANIDKNVVLDSDDDLEPYPIPVGENDERPTAKSKTKKFPYLRDTIEILSDSKTSYQDYEAAFNALIILTSKEPPDMQDNLDNILKLLLHMEQKNLDDFDEKRLRGLANVCVKFPLHTSRFLIDEFYAPNNSLQTRFDCLDVLRISAKGLAEHTPQTAISIDRSVEKCLSDYRTAIDKRIAEKTRYFNSKKSPDVREKTSKFAKIASNFFYPLLSKFDRPADQTVDLVNRDSFLLARLLYTAGCILQYAEFCADSPSMCSKMFEFAWNLRSNLDSEVRKASLYCFASVLMCLPPEILLTFIGSELQELYLYLQYGKDNESDSAVRSMIKTVYDFMRSRISNCLNLFKECST